MKETMKKLWTKVSAYVLANKMKIGLLSAIGIVVVAAIVVTVCLWPGLKDDRPSEKDSGVRTEEQINNQKSDEAERLAQEEAARKAEEERKAAEAAEAERLAKETDKKDKEEVVESEDPATQKPVTTTKAPKPTTKKPATTTKKPVTTTKKPVTTTQAPKPTTTPPATTKTPTTTTKNPNSNITPELQEKLDALKTCKFCGRKKGYGNNGTCVRFPHEMDCPRCGVHVRGLTCHTCG